MNRERLESDVIYGEYEIANPVLSKLLSSAPMQRLKGLNQYGLPDRYYHLDGFSRFDHSVGVMLLLQSLGASEEEQIAGLLHDVSHKAFSHIYDWVVGTQDQENSQDEGHDQFIRNSPLHHVLEQYGHSTDRITDYHHFGLLERESPDLCADRVDYVLREIDPRVAKAIFQGLTTFNGQVVCADQDTASLLGRAFLARQTEHWGGWEGVSRYFLFSSTLKHALELGIIQKADFLVDDEHIINKLETCSDKLIISTLTELSQNPLRLPANGPTVRKKFRFIDPPFIKNGAMVRLTEADDEYKRSLEIAKQENQSGVTVPKFPI